MNKPGTKRMMASALGLETPLDKFLFGASIITIAVLIGIILILWRRRSQVGSHRSSEMAIEQIGKEKKKAKGTNYPTITFSQKSRTDSTGSLDSQVSSMWDSQSQRFDKKYFKDIELRNEIDKCLTASRDIESGPDEDESLSNAPSSCTSDFGSAVEREDDDIMLPEFRISADRKDETKFVYAQKRQMSILSKSEDCDVIESRDDYYESERRGSI